MIDDLLKLLSRVIGKRLLTIIEIFIFLVTIFYRIESNPGVITFIKEKVLMFPIIMVIAIFVTSVLPIKDKPGKEHVGSVCKVTNELLMFSIIIVVTIFVTSMLPIEDRLGKENVESVCKVTNELPIEDKPGKEYVGSVCKIIVTSGRARMQPGIESSTLKYVELGQEYTILDTDTAADNTLWYMIRVEDCICWISSGIASLN